MYVYLDMYDCVLVCLCFVTRIQHNAGGAPRRTQRQHRLDRHIHRRNVKLLKHNLHKTKHHLISTAAIALLCLSHEKTHLPESSSHGQPWG